MCTNSATEGKTGGYLYSVGNDGSNKESDGCHWQGQV